MSTIQCNIVSPEGELFSGPVELLSAEGGAGEIAITPRHAPLLTNLKPGPVKLVLEGGEEEVFFASGGYLEVQPGEVTLLTDVAERADDIDSAAAERAKELAERELEDQKSEMDYSLAASQLAEAAARLKALQKLRKKQLNKKTTWGECAIVPMNIDFIILAAGKGTRMGGDSPKVLASLAGKPMIQHLIDTVDSFPKSKTSIIVGYKSKEVESGVASSKKISFINQKKQLGTAHAVKPVSYTHLTLPTT